MQGWLFFFFSPHRSLVENVLLVNKYVVFAKTESVSLCENLSTPELAVLSLLLELRWAFFPYSCRGGACILLSSPSNFIFYIHIKSAKQRKKPWKQNQVKNHRIPALFVVLLLFLAYNFQVRAGEWCILPQNKLESNWVIYRASIQMIWFSSLWSYMDLLNNL